MKIACIGWGSLIWDPREFNAEKAWKEDGPVLPLEFARKSSDGRLTLVIYPDAKQSKTYWTIMHANELLDAKTSLAKREGCPTLRPIGCLERTTLPIDAIQKIIHEWLIASNCDAVIWTNLSAKFYEDKGTQAPSLKDALEYLAGLKDDAYIKAEEYVRKAPPNIRTYFREKFEQKLGWLPMD
ncbi:hypothetical protein DJ568_00010 [Mucilaginibacter hurinus]|uniref:Uncharacterized protein n=1 Tax=Mucilaginibacter hurinus TaxID=2201324 RepID=A0A367GTY2_9SPHI|nr:hypothetical protein [Mucilaginibacter hurinus]RCH56286.1 hypothetical protein DJ568_00010 [Mucilaginibacter hurinus]